MTHPLQNTWTFWEHRKAVHQPRNSRGASNDYGDNMYQIGDCSTVEDFWRFKNNLPNPSDLFFFRDSPRMKFADREIEGYSLFKQGIRPEWEDKANANGGEITARRSFESKELDDIYENLLLGLIGETLDPNDEICGVRVVDKSKPPKTLYKVELWLRNKDPKVQKTIQDNCAKCVGQHVLVDFRAH